MKANDRDLSLRQKYTHNSLLAYQNSSVGSCYNTDDKKFEAIGNLSNASMTH